jgi:hypothetical protein
MDRKKSKEMVEDLRNRFLDGEKLTVEDIIKDYFTPNDTLKYLLAKKQVRGWINSIKKYFKVTEGLWFGSLDPNGNYGLITTMEEAAFAMVRYYKFVKGNLTNANILANDAERKGILPDGIVRERILLANIIKPEEEEEKK